MSITILKITPHRQNTLLGFCDITFGPSLIIHGVSLHSRDGTFRASPPSRPVINRDGSVQKEANGKFIYSPSVSFASKAARDQFSAAVVEAIRLHSPDLLAVEDAP